MNPTSSMRQRPPTSGGKPSDQLIRQQAESLLQDSGYRSLSQLECRVCDGMVELSGCVPSFYLKQLAQTMASRVDDVRGVLNRVQVHG